jgi:NAD(P)H-hydrate epimerase
MSAGQTHTTTKLLEEQVLNVWRIAKKYGITIILKGYYNIICDGHITVGQQKRAAVIKRTTPAMTVGGCGDVLSGIVAGVFSKLSDAFYASIAGVYLSGVAGSLAHKKLGLHMVPTDLIEQLPNAMKSFDKVILNSKQ